MSEVNWIDEFYRLNPDAQEEEVVKAKKENILPLATELINMDMRNFDFYASLTDEQKKEISIWILMRYMSSSNSDVIDHLLTVNDFVNHNFNDLSKHPELQWKLLAVCGTGKKQFHPWIPPPRGKKKNKLQSVLSEIFPLLRSDELDLILKINSKEEIKEFLIDYGLEEKQVKEILKDLEIKK